MKQKTFDLLSKYDIEVIENTAIKILLDNHNIQSTKNLFINQKLKKVNNSLYLDLTNHFKLTNLDELNKFFEELFNEEEKIKNGIVFTPEYIADFIVGNTIKHFNQNTKIIDPACGCGIFLISAIKKLRTYKKSIIDIIENHIFGIDLKKENVERVKIIISIYSIFNGEDAKEIRFNLATNDSLFCDWIKEFNVGNFDYIIGNPPYINNHDLKKDYIQQLKDCFCTTQDGTFNIFYAFIEKSSHYLTATGIIGFIIPNNFIHIKSAKKLRTYIKDNHLLNTIIDFKDNTLFAPTLTYNCLIFLSKNNNSFKYSHISKINNVAQALSNIKHSEKSPAFLDDDGWKLVDDNTYENILKIENYPNKIDEFIKTGIATLRDNLYIIDGFDEVKNMYFKWFDNNRFYIENEALKPFIKISKYKSKNDVSKIIFPYKTDGKQVIPIDEKEIKMDFPLLYKYLLKIKKKLAERDKGTQIKPWYAYGRSQGLNLFDKKIIYSTFNLMPNFIKCPIDDVLISNGYCITNYNFDEEVIIKILNSSIMHYYVTNTSYHIAGNYKCFQKKYIKNFSIPVLSNEDINNIRNLNGEQLNLFLWNLYNLK